MKVIQVPDVEDNAWIANVSPFDDDMPNPRTFMPLFAQVIARLQLCYNLWRSAPTSASQAPSNRVGEVSRCVMMYVGSMLIISKEVDPDQSVAVIVNEDRATVA